MKFLLASITIFLLAGCATGGANIASTSSQADKVEAIKAGSIRFSCVVACSGSWGAERKTAKALYEAELWSDLALHVTAIGFESDLSYYYLGRATEGLGSIDAARTYYKLASISSNKCNGLINNCDGLLVAPLVKQRLAGLPAATLNSTVAQANVTSVTTSPSAGKPVVIETSRAAASTLAKASVPPPVEVEKQDVIGPEAKVKVEYDDFKKLTTYVGATVHKGSTESLLRAWKLDSGRVTFQMYIADTYGGSWRFYNAAWDSTGKALAILVIDREVISCRYGCTHTEHIGVDVTKEYLDKAQGTGIRLKLSGKAGETIVELPGAYVKAFLAAIK